MKVMKFGGASIKDPAGLLQVTEIVALEKEDRVVVLSAVYGQTNEIREFAQAAKTGDADIDGFIEKVKNRHVSIAKMALKDEKSVGKAEHDIWEKTMKLERLLYGIAYTNELTEQTFDLIQSYGERLSLPLLEHALRERGIDAMSFESDRIGIISDGVFGNATANIPMTRENLFKTIIPELKRGTVPIITGFFGKGPDGRTTTFGRNGSDYSAAVIANALDAGVLEVWKDVDGFMSADPKIVPEAKNIGQLSYDEAGEIAYFGSKILHPRTIEPLRTKEIPIALRNTQKPSSTGTWVTATGATETGRIKSVSHSTELALLKIYGAGFGHRPGVASKITEILFRNNIGIYSIVTSQTCLCMIIHSRDAGRASGSLGNSGIGSIERVELDTDIALVNVVGDGIGREKDIPGAVFTTVGEAGVNIKLVSIGGTLNALNLIVSNGDLAKAVKAIHGRFIPV